MATPDLSKIDVSMVPNSTASLGLHESAAAAGCYAFVEEVWFVDERVDQALVREVRESIPNFVPLKCRRVYRSPGGTLEPHDYTVIGMCIEHPTDAYKDDYIRLQSVPAKFPFPTGKIQAVRTLWAEWEPGSLEYEQSYPPAPVMFSKHVVEQMRALRKMFDGAIRIDGDDVKQGDSRGDALNAILTAEQRRDEQMMEKAREEARYRCRHNWAQLKAAADAERWTPPEAEKKLFLDLKG